MFAALAVLAALWMSAPGVGAQSACAARGPVGADGFYCWGRCLREEHRCDGKVDCYFAEDEYDCETCKRGAFQCVEKLELPPPRSPRLLPAIQPALQPRSRCFAAYRRCDSHQDCLDNSDEEGCKYENQSLLVCSAGRAGSASGRRNKVQSVMVKCDGRYDCPGPDVTDERDCTQPNRCLPNQTFFCDFTCHPKSKWCDDEIDCRDGQDEADCAFTVSLSGSTLAIADLTLATEDGSPPSTEHMAAASEAVDSSTRTHPIRIVDANETDATAGEPEDANKGTRWHPAIYFGVPIYAACVLFVCFFIFHLFARRRSDEDAEAPQGQDEGANPFLVLNNDEPSAFHDAVMEMELQEPPIRGP